MTHEMMEGRQIIGPAGAPGGITLVKDARDWLAAWPDGTAGVLCIRPDGERIPVEATVTGTLMYAELPDECIAWPGMYLYEFNWSSGGAMVERQTYTCILTGTAPGPIRPHRREYVPDWATQIFEKADLTVTASAAASESAETADEAAGAATSAKEDAETAQGKAEDAQESAEAARDRAEAAATLAQEHSMGFSYSSGVLTLSPLTD